MRAERLQNGQEYLRQYGAVAVLILLILVNSLVTPNFFAVGTLWNVLLQSFPVILISMGMTLVIATGGIDISVGATMALSSIVLAKLLIHMETSFPVAMLAAMGAAALFGLFNGILIGVFRFQPIEATLILMISGRGIAQLFNKGVVIYFYGNQYTELGVYRIGGVLPIQVVLILAVLALMLFVTYKTSFGRYVQAVGDNRSASNLSGVNTVLVLIAVYVLCALLTGFASCIETLRICSADPNNIGDGIELDCVAAVAVGGTSMAGGRARMMGTLAGALVMQLITTMVNMNNVAYAYSLVIKSAIIVLALYLQKKKSN